METKELISNDHPLYNKTNYPIFVCNDGPWNIYMNDKEYCVAIPVSAEGGYLASHYGDRNYVRATLGI